MASGSSGPMGRSLFPQASRKNDSPNPWSDMELYCWSFYAGTITVFCLLAPTPFSPKDWAFIHCRKNAPPPRKAPPFSEGVPVYRDFRRPPRGGGLCIVLARGGAGSRWGWRRPKGTPLHCRNSWVSNSLPVSNRNSVWAACPRRAGSSGGW